jgi:hypothetical protein
MAETSQSYDNLMAKTPVVGVFVPVMKAVQDVLVGLGVIKGPGDEMGMMQDRWNEMKDYPYVFISQYILSDGTLSQITNASQIFYIDSWPPENNKYWKDMYVNRGTYPIIKLAEGIYTKKDNNGNVQQFSFVNVIAKIISDLTIQQQQQAAAELKIQQDKSTYGPLYPLVNWFRTSPTVQNTVNEFKAGTTQIGQDIKTATGGSLTSSPWLIGSMVVVGGLAIVYVILED